MYTNIQILCTHLSTYKPSETRLCKRCHHRSHKLLPSSGRQTTESELQESFDFKHNLAGVERVLSPRSLSSTKSPCWTRLVSGQSNDLLRFERPTGRSIETICPSVKDRRSSRFFSAIRGSGDSFLVLELPSTRWAQHLFRAIRTRDYQTCLHRIWCLEPIEKLIEVSFEIRRFETALPDHSNPPSQVPQCGNVFLIPLHISFELLSPEIRSCCGSGRVSALWMAVPEATMNEDSDSAAGHHDIRPPRELAMVQSVPVSTSV